MNQNIQILNVSKGVVNLAGKYQIQPGKSIVLGVTEYPQILSKINLQKQLGWIDWKFVPVTLSPEVTKTVSAVKPVETTEPENHVEPTSDSLLFAKKRGRPKQEEPKIDDSKGTV